jgi:hypothetical protein
VASGFLVLADGRCYAPRWAFYDAVLRAVAAAIDDTAEGRALRVWLLAQLPGPQDIQHIGHGPWVRASDEQTIERFLDVRVLTPQNQRCLLDLGDMVARADRGEPPLSRSDWREVLHSQGRRIGPGW